jgi:hypothetical protein
MFTFPGNAGRAEDAIRFMLARDTLGEFSEQS